ncbi:MAG: hypothetical protein KUG77_06055 [Nannocystaceae bacterium]|nr:hypothetical protein [Nannocystaceae bacterium]
MDRLVWLLALAACTPRASDEEVFGEACGARDRALQEWVRRAESGGPAPFRGMSRCEEVLHEVARTDRAVANKVAACLLRTRVEDLERPPETREAECIDPSERERLEEAVSTVRARHHGDGLAAEFKALGEDETAPSQ